MPRRNLIGWFILECKTKGFGRFLALDFSRQWRYCRRWVQLNRQHATRRNMLLTRCPCRCRSLSSIGNGKDQGKGGTAKLHDGDYTIFLLSVADGVCVCCDGSNKHRQQDVRWCGCLTWERKSKKKAVRQRVNRSIFYATGFTSKTTFFAPSLNFEHTFLKLSVTVSFFEFQGKRYLTYNKSLLCWPDTRNPTPSFSSWRRRQWPPWSVVHVLLKQTRRRKLFNLFQPKALLVVGYFDFSLWFPVASISRNTGFNVYKSIFKIE